ncbi:hypothetical protein PFLUV_G00269070 [Perca fluviatilis]|uniref:Uncharacterized protein n=1 Tax=Perca fluviatilis TaxID=8168 RepID=A0A6A5ECK4_PERFL|nr:hypothetical protein PFLUV_G00269070 [Perca fluviatilis]
MYDDDDDEADDEDDDEADDEDDDDGVFQSSPWSNLVTLNRHHATAVMAKVDIVSRTHVEWYQENCYPSEPVFVASPGATEEDDADTLSPPQSSRASSFLERGHLNIERVRPDV